MPLLVKEIDQFTQLLNWGTTILLVEQDVEPAL